MASLVHYQYIIFKTNSAATFLNIEFLIMPVVLDSSRLNETFSEFGDKILINPLVLRNQPFLHLFSFNEDYQAKT